MFIIVSSKWMQMNLHFGKEPEEDVEENYVSQVGGDFTPAPVPGEYEEEYEEDARFGFSPVRG